MAERQSAGAFVLRSDTVEGLRQELNFVLQHLANQVDQLTGNRGTPTLRANLNMTGKRITGLGAPTADDHAVPAGYALTRASARGAYDAGQVGIQNLPSGINQSDAVNLAQLLALRTTDLADFNEAAQDAVGAALTDTATVDFTYTDASNQITADVIDDSISNAKLRNSAAVSVIGRSANSSGDPADIAASADTDVLRRSSSVLGFGQITTAYLSDYSEASFTVTGTGFTVNPTGTASYVKLGNLVCLLLPQLTGTSNATTFTLTGLPAAIQPTQTAFRVTRMMDNSADSSGRILRLNAGSTTIDLFSSAALAAFTAAGTKTLYACYVTYNLL